MEGIKKIILILTLSLFLSLIFSGFLFAQKELEIEYPEMQGLKPETTTFSLPDYVKYIFNFFLAIAGLIAFSALVYGGIRYLTSAGSPVLIKEARDQIFAAFLGLLILLGSYLILTTINPQLVFLKLPERKVFQEEISEVPTPEEKTLAYTEIPIGWIIGELFTKERLGRIKDISENLNEIAQDVEKKSNELDSLINQCSCDLTSPQCAGECSGGFCVGDPCPVRDEINQKREEVQNYIGEEKFEVDLGVLGKVKLKGLRFWQKKIEKEINGSEKEKFIGFRKLYEDLKVAEELIKNCSLSTSKRGKSQILLGASGFEEYRDFLRDYYEIKKTEPERPFSYIPPDNPYNLATFYCAEVLYPVPTFAAISEDYLSSVLKETPEIIKKKKEPVCDREIPIGEIVDNAEELARQILKELDNINDNSQKEITATQSLVELSDPSNCVVGSCSTDCIWIEKTCCDPCPEEEETKEGSTNEEGGLDWGNWEDWGDWFFWMLSPSKVFAQGDCCYDCSYCEILPCTGSLCPGDPALKGQINNQTSIIQNSSSQITESKKKVKNLIEEKKIEDKIKKSKIFEILNYAQGKLNLCYNSKEEQRKVEQGTEKVFWEELRSCSYILQSLEGKIPFYDEGGKEITECYGPTLETTDLLDNFFCCGTELFSE
jgi:hypothetical protein